MVRCLLVLAATTLLGMNRMVRIMHHNPTMGLSEARRPESSSGAPSRHRRLLIFTASSCVEKRRIRVHDTEWLSPLRLPSSTTSLTHSSLNIQHFSTNTPLAHLYFRLLKLPLRHNKPSKIGSWAPGKYESPGTGYNDGTWSPEKYPAGSKAKRTDGGTWHEGKYEGPGTRYDDGKWAPGKYDNKSKARETDDGSWYEGKYEGGETSYDDGKWAPGKYD